MGRFYGSKRTRNAARRSLPPGTKSGRLRAGALPVRSVPIRSYAAERGSLALAAAAPGVSVRTPARGAGGFSLPSASERDSTFRA